MYSLLGYLKFHFANVYSVFEYVTKGSCHRCLGIIIHLCFMFEEVNKIITSRASVVVCMLLTR